MLATITIVGRLGRDPELKHLPNNVKMCILAVAVTRHIKSKGKTTVKTDWHKVVVFGGSAENTAKLCSKGSMVALTGQPQSSSYKLEDENRRRTSWEIHTSFVKLLSDGEQGGGKRGDLE